jgi:hypothetical protein
MFVIGDNIPPIVDTPKKKIFLLELKRQIEKNNLP